MARLPSDVPAAAPGLRPRRLAMLALLALGAAAHAQELSEAEARAAQRARFAPRDRSPVLLDLSTVHVGSRAFDGRLMDESLGDTTAFGFEYAARDEATGFGFEAALFYAGGSGDVFAGSTLYELDLDLIDLELGGRYTHRLGRGPLYAYLGGGADLLYALGDVRRTAASGTVSDDLDSFAKGLYAHAGLYLVTPESWVVGVDVRKTIGTEIRSGPLEAQMENVQVGLVVGTGY